MYKVIMSNGISYLVSKEDYSKLIVTYGLKLITVENHNDNKDKVVINKDFISSIEKIKQ